MDDHREGDAPARPRDVFPLTLRARLAPPEQFGRAKTAPVNGHHLAPLIVGLGLVVLVIALTVFGFTLSWTGDHRSPLALGVLRTQIIGGAAQFAIYGLAALALIFLLARRPTRRRLIVAGASIAGGAIVAGIVLTIVGVTNVLGVALSATMTAWIVAGFAFTALGIASFWAAKGWRTIGVAVSIVLVLLAGTLGVNADFGLDPTVGALAGVSTLDAITVPVIKSTPQARPTALDGGALWANWVPPADMPKVGSASTVDIPGTISGFAARPAGIYYPPASLVKNPPALPLVIMMMGQPGNPDPQFQEQVLDQFAVDHQGLAPIVIVADQIGNPAVDPLCLNTPRYGNAETYITQDVVNWARTHLKILSDPAHMTIAGYSNGGECALAFGSKFPSIWGNVLDISGEQYPGADESGAVLSSIFHGNQAAYQATWPTNILATGTYPNTVGIFTVGSNDLVYRRVAMTVSAAAAAAAWKTTYFEVPNGGHVLVALNGGLVEGYTVLYPRLGLSKPALTPAPTSTSPG